jgi:hypothetical protein
MTQDQLKDLAVPDMFKTDKSKSPKEDKVDQSKYNVLAMKAFEPQVKSSPRDHTIS